MKQKQQILNTTMLSSETGRSMVEMLGVLAIIGVLSVGGIAGYTMAMNKHKANELLDEASKRAVVVSGHLLSGKAGSIAEFTDPSGYKFEYVAVEGQNQFKLTLKTSAGGKIDDASCAQIKNVVGGEHINPSVNIDCTELTYNNDLTTSITPVSSGKPDVKVTACSTSGNGEYTNEYIDHIVEDGGSSWREFCQCPTSTPIWNGSECETAIAPGNDCTNNTDCSSLGSNYYCRFGNFECEDDYTEPNPGTGICVQLGGMKVIDGHKISRETMDWYSADNWCKAQGSTGLLTIGSKIGNITIDESLTDSLFEKGFFEADYWLKDVFDGFFCHANKLGVGHDNDVYVGPDDNGGRALQRYHALCK